MNETAQAHRNLVGLMLVRDTNQIGSDEPTIVFLHRLGQEGWIYLQQTDVVEEELRDAPEDKLPELSAAAATQATIWGPYVTFVPTQSDVQRFYDVAQVLLPGTDLAATRKNNIRDVLHVATAIRSCANGFVTNDKRMLAKAQAIAASFDGFRLLPPRLAVELAMERVRTMRRLHKLEPSRGPLPDWPADEGP